MTYNITNITGANNLVEIIEATNQLSNGVFFMLLMPIIFFIFLIVFKGRDFKKVLLADSFFMVIISGLAWGMNFVGWTYVIIPILLFGGSIIVYQFMD